jgi:hypothetical protein
MLIVTVVLAVSLFNVLGIIVGETCARMPASLATAILLLSTVMAGIVACSSSPSVPQEVSFPTVDGGTVVADLHAARGSTA